MADPSLEAVSDEQLELLRRLVESETGMDLGGRKRQRLHEATKRALQPAKQLPEIPSILADSKRRTRLVEKITAELTVGESFFFRNHHHFEALAEHVLPLIFAENATQKTVNAWSAGCAAGEEPYSLAILLRQNLQHDSAWQISVLGTDINHQFVEKGRQAVFRPWSFRQTQIHHDRRYFLPKSGSYCVTEPYKSCVHFAHLNLIKDPFPSPPSGALGFDLILFRNVAIYLKADVIEALIHKFHAALRPGGWLLLGEAEVNLAPTAGFEVHRFASATFYRKPASNAAHPTRESDWPWSPHAMAPQWPNFASPSVAQLPPWPPLGPTGDIFPQAAASLPLNLLPPENSADNERRASRRVILELVEGQPPCPPEKSLRASHDPLKAARTLFARAELAAARHELSLCLRKHPFLVEGYLLMAALAEENGNWHVAESAYRRALYLDRDCCLAHLHLAMVQQQLGDKRGAQRSIHNTLRLSEAKDPEAMVEYGDGVCYGRLREMALAIQETAS